MIPISTSCVSGIYLRLIFDQIQTTVRGHQSLQKPKAYHHQIFNVVGVSLVVFFFQVPAIELLFDPLRSFMLVELLVADLQLRYCTQALNERVEKVVCFDRTGKKAEGCVEDFDF